LKDSMPKTPSKGGEGDNEDAHNDDQNYHLKVPENFQPTSVSWDEKQHPKRGTPPTMFVSNPQTVEILRRLKIPDIIGKYLSGEEEKEQKQQHSKPLLSVVSRENNPEEIDIDDDDDDDDDGKEKGTEGGKNTDAAAAAATKSAAGNPEEIDIDSNDDDDDGEDNDDDDNDPEGNVNGEGREVKKRKLG